MALGSVDIDINEFYKAYIYNVRRQDPIDIYNEACAALNETRKRYVNEQVSEAEFSKVYNRWKAAKKAYEASK